MKKFLAVILAMLLGMCVCLAACGGTPQDPAGTTPNGQESTENNQDDDGDGGDKETEGDEDTNPDGGDEEPDEGGEGTGGDEEPDEGGSDEEGGSTPDEGGDDDEPCAHHYTAENVCSLCGDEWEYTEGLNYELDTTTSTYAVGRNTNASGDVVIPYGYNGKFVTKIKSEAFGECKGITDITIPGSIQLVEYAAFSTSNNDIEHITVTKDNPNYKSENECLIEIQTNTLVLGCKNSVIPNGVVIIGSGAFGFCNKIEQVTIPSSVIEIKDYAFYYCINLRYLTISEGVTSLKCDRLAVAVCPKLAEIWNFSTVQIEMGEGLAMYAKAIYTTNEASKQTKTSDGYVFYEDGDEAYLLGHMGGESELTLPARSPNGQRYKIVDCAFVGYGDYDYWRGGWFNGIKKVIIPDGVTEIGQEAFVGYPELTDVTISNSVTKIGEGAFSGCTGIAFTFLGTTQEWKAIDKVKNGNNDWDSLTGDYTVTCTDGTVDKQGNVTYFEN